MFSMNLAYYFYFVIFHETMIIDHDHRFLKTYTQTTTELGFMIRDGFSDGEKFEKFSHFSDADSFRYPSDTLGAISETHFQCFWSHFKLCASKKRENRSVSQVRLPTSPLLSIYLFYIVTKDHFWLLILSQAKDTKLFHCINF